MTGRRNVLINRNYARLWAGQAASTVGDFAFDTTLVLWIGTILAKDSSGQIASWAPAAVSGLMICVFGATMVVGPIAGVFVDRWSHRTTMLMSEVVRAVAVAALTALSLLPKRFAADLALADSALRGGVPDQLGGAVLHAGPIRRARRHRRRRVRPGSGRRDRPGHAATAAIIGPPLAAPLLVTSGLQWALLLNAASYVFSYFAIRSIRSRRRTPRRIRTEAATKPRIWPEFVAGLKMFASNRFLVALLTIAVVCQLGTGAINALDVFFITGNLHANSHLFGLASMCFGIGSIVGALLAGTFVKMIGARTMTWVTLILGGGLFIAYSRQTVFVWGFCWSSGSRSR